MRRGRLTTFLIAAALALVAGIVLLRLQGPATADGPPSAGAGVLAPRAVAGADATAPRFDAADQAQPAVPMPAAAQEPQEDATPVASADPALVLGRVLRAADGSPVAGVTVDAVTAGDRTLASAGTDAAGSFRISIPAGSSVQALIAHSGPDTVGARVDVRRRIAADEQLARDLRVGSGGRLSGWVVDEHGVPVPGADVLCWNARPEALGSAQLAAPDRRTSCNAAGEFVLNSLGPAFTATATAPGFAACKLLAGTIDEGAQLGGAGWAGGTGGPATATAADPAHSSALTIVLSPARTIRGRVIDERERPIAGAAVTLEMHWNMLDPSLTAAPGVSRVSAPSRDLLTGADGSFAFDGCCRELCELAVRREGYVGWWAPAMPDESEFLVTLSRGASLAGVVTSSVTRSPVAGARVEVRAGGDGGLLTSGGLTLTDAEGGFSIGGLIPTSHGEALVHAEGFATQTVFPLVVRESDNPLLNVPLDLERILAGVVVDGGERPLPDAIISIDGDRSWERRTTASDAEGRFRFGQLGEASLDLRAEHPLDAGVFVTRTVDSGTTDLRLVLDMTSLHGVVFTGTVHDAVTHQPITVFRVTPNLRGADGEYNGYSRRVEDQAGRFRITGLDPGKMILTVDAPGYMLRSFGEQEYAEGEHRIDAELQVMRSLEVRVLDRLRRPAAAQLIFTSEDAGQLWVQSGDGISTNYAHTDVKGWALLRGLPAEQLSVEVTCGRDATPQVFPVDLRSPPLGPLELVLDRCRPVRISLGAFGGTTELAASLDMTRRETAVPALLEASSKGTAWTLDAPCTVRALAADGRVFAQTALRSDGVVPREHNGFSPLVADLSVPEEPLTLEFSAEGYVTLTLPWQPAATPSGSDAQSATPGAEASAGSLFVVLTRS